MYRSSSSTNKAKVTTNVGVTASRGHALAARPQTLHSTAGVDFEDRYRRAAEENTQLKKERNELEEKLKECKTKLRRLTRDLMVSGGPDAGNNISVTSSTTPTLKTGGVNSDETRKGPSSPNSNGGRSGPPRPASGAACGADRDNAPQNAAAAPSFHQPQHIAPSFSTIHTSLLEQEKKRLEESLQRAKAQIEYMQSEMIKMQKSAPPAEQNAMHLATQIQLLHQQLDNARTTKESDERRIVELQRERDVVHSDLAGITSQLKQSDQCRAVLQQQLTEALAALASATTNSNGAVNAQQQQQQTRGTGLASFELGSDFYKRQVSELMGQLQTMRDQQLQDQHTIETSIRERDAARIQLGRARAAAAGAGINLSGAELAGEAVTVAARGSEGGSGTFDAASMHDLQRALAEKSAQILVLTNQVNFAQSRAEATKKESERVLEDLKSIHVQHAEVKRNMFQLEHEKASLILRCEKVPALEATLELKTQELLKSEHELLKCIDRLQSCSRDTELQVRKEIGDRIAELENMRDKAEADRRACEREVLAVKLELSDSKRRLENALHDTELYKREAQRLEAEKKEMMDRVALANVTGIAGFSSMGGGGNNMSNATVGNGEDTTNNTINNNSTLVGAFGLPISLDDDVSRAVALAALRKRATGAADRGLGSAIDLKNNNANEVMAMWEGMEWSDGKELSLLRETLAATAVDIELAETRCVQLQQAVADKTKLLEGISSERDELLNENIELRHRISGVQTALARAHLQKISASSALTKNGSKAHSSTTTLVISLNSISCDPILQQRDDGKMYTPTLFFSLELEGMGAGHQYEPVLSETFYALNSQLSVQFVFENIDVEAINFTTIQKVSFVLQLHQSFGVESEIVACASLSGARLLHCRYDGVHHDKLQLLSLEGTEIGSVDVTVAAPDLLLPILLARPIISAVTPDSIRSALIAFRSVRALRIQVFGASDLYCQAGGGTNNSSPPSPYVYYTSTSPHGITFIAETMVSPSSRTATANPVFDLVPVDHQVILDPEFVRFMSDGSLSFVVFDHKAADVQSNLGIAVIQLAEMLTSPTFVFQKRLPLHPQGSLEVGISWVRSAASE